MAANEESDLGEISVTSRSMSAEQLTETLAGLGMDVVETTETRDGAAPDDAAGTEVAEGEAEPVAAAPPAQEATPPAETEEAKISRRQAATARRAQEIADLRADNERLKSENQRYKATPAPAAAPVADKTPAPVVEKPVETSSVVVPDEPKKPNPDDFADGLYDPAYQEAILDYRFEVRDRNTALKAKEAADVKAETERTQREAKAREMADRSTKEASDRWNTSADAARNEFDDYEEVMARPHATPPEVLLTAVLDNPRAASLAYYLITHPKDEKRLSKLAELPEKHSVTAWRKAYAKVLAELDTIEQGLEPAASQVAAPASEVQPDPNEPEEDLSAARRVPQRQVAAPAAPAKPAPPAQPTPSPKPKVLTPVGNRGLPTNKSVRSLPPDELRKLDPLSDEYRQQMGMR